MLLGKGESLKIWKFYEMIGKTISHYKIIEKIGAGGMAVVYKAEDTNLKRTVALKFVSPIKLGKEDTKTRFIQEAQTAAGLNHPNIMTIYEIEEAEDQTFIAMEYVEGANLRDIVTSKPLSLGKSLNIALQIAEGLHEAHDQGIIHRDIKSSNIMITPKGQIKIMDFGLVKLEGATQITKTSMVMGTVSYMSPEQAGGDDVDNRTDIWSFGVVLYEMLTGRLPFRGANDQVILLSILNKKHEPISTFRADMPLLLADIVDKCLKKNPKERYQTVADLKADLEHLKKEITSDHATLSLPGRLISRLYRKPLIRIAAPLSGALLVLIALILFMPFPQFVKNWISPQSRSIIIIPFTIRGGQPEDVEFCVGLMDVVTSKIAQLLDPNDFWIFPNLDVRDEAVKSAGEARRKFNADLVLEPIMHVNRDQALFIINLIDAKFPRTIDSTELVYNRQNRLGVENDFVREMISMLGVKLPPQAQFALTKGDTENKEALNYYLSGLSYLQRYEKLENIGFAIDLFTQSIEADPNYALAYAGLGEAYWRRWKETKENDFVDKAQHYCERAAAISMNLAPVHITLGIIHRDTGRYNQAIEELETALKIEPKNAQAHREMGRTYQVLGDMERAEQFFEKAIDLLPNYWGGYNQLGAFYYSAGRFDKAVQMFKKVTELTPDNSRGFYNLGGCYIQLGRNDLAESILKRAIDIQPSGSSFNNLATAYFNQGEYAKAVQTYEKALEYVENNYIIWGNLADSRRFTGQYTEDQIRADYQRAKELVAKNLDINPRDIIARAHLAYYLAILGEKNGALLEIAEVLKSNPKDIEILRKIVQIYEFTGEREKALQAFQSYLGNGGTLNTILSDPDMADLQKDSRFQSLTKK